MANSNNPPKNPRAWEALTPSLSQWILDAVSAMGFSRMTPVQASAIPLFMGNKDVVVEAVTGSGKTMSFLIPVIEKLLRLDSAVKKHHVGAIIVSPTRSELAEQIHTVLLSLLAFHGPSASKLAQLEGKEPGLDPETGGTTTPAQDLSVFLKRSPNLLISTPGRLLELLSSPHVHCPQSSFEVLVLDEADRLLDLGFKDDLQKILGRLPKQRRTGLFSASVSEAVDQIVRVGLRNPVKIAVKVRGAGAEDKRTPARIPALSKLLSSISPVPQKSIIYFSTCAAVDYFSLILPLLLPSSFTTVPLHGKHAPTVRQRNFSRFTQSVAPTILLTTDVAARGLDIPLVDLVVQLDPPTDPKVYIHRCGRAGRAGRRGLSVLFLTSGREEDYIPFLEVRKTPAMPFSAPAINTTDAEAQNTTDTIRRSVLADRAVHDKAQRAFVSWVRSYSKHQTSSIFRVADIDWEETGRSWGLLHLPKMPELKEFKGDKMLGLGPGDVDWDSFAYKDKQKEKSRLAALAEAKEKGEGPRMSRKRSAAAGDNSTVAWSKKLDKKGEKERKRERKRVKREHTMIEAMTEDERAELRRTNEMLEKVRKANIEARKVNPASSKKKVESHDADDVNDDEPFEGFD
ncbi:ATP-dependent rRNA helicase spb4 [Microsporum canis CBS 113480]|uniref:ATP-dependent RNA helicase n=1 Tax=Arthroderma otae (strain ATCC MYA-4605 / CBS 113480) TaxID=554155 RepID=C5FD77_ARTOC|nr:ATP-dependent rRNA helicase spb4 [Microsporum canis CBS 113480]EEQ27761.1 ATP-dependent rRNA helicase spb4 [Microsporum canis CBS 113480]